MVAKSSRTRACVVFGDRIPVAVLPRIRQARANVTLAHIWHPEKGKRHSERTFTKVLRCTETEARANLMPAHIWRPSRAKRAFWLTFTNGFRSGTRFGSKLQETRSPGSTPTQVWQPENSKLVRTANQKAQTSTCVTFREIDAETQKPVRA